MEPETQTEAILADLMRGRHITPLDALADYGCFRLAARVCELRDRGHAIFTTHKRLPNGKRVAVYSLEAWE